MRKSMIFPRTKILSENISAKVCDFQYLKNSILHTFPHIKAFFYTNFLKNTACPYHILLVHYISGIFLAYCTTFCGNILSLLLNVNIFSTNNSIFPKKFHYFLKFSATTVAKVATFLMSDQLVCLSWIFWTYSQTDKIKVYSPRRRSSHRRLGLHKYIHIIVLLSQAGAKT